VSTLLAVLAFVPTAFAASAVDQYSEGLPTAGGQKSTHDTVAQGGGTARIAPDTRAQLGKGRKGRAAERAAEISAPRRDDSVGPNTSGTDDGLGLLLPLILAATLVTGIGIFYARRRLGTTPS